MTRRLPWRRWVADVHLWLSLVVGLQVLAWMVSGLFMVIQPIERVRSEHRLSTLPPVNLAQAGAPIAPAEVMKAMGAPVSRVALEQVGDRVVYVVETNEAKKALFDAWTGAKVSPIDETFAREIAERAISGDARPGGATLIEKDPPIEYRGALPVWRLDFEDSEKLSVYVDASTGRVAARRSDLWRAYDFLWSLHIMDYRERENFNHPLLIVFTALALVMTLAGLILLAIRLPQRFPNKAKERSS